eukprot:CAMPEP_0178387300 /NCGR_PEP_ID=MMETSP0689_2-20121128/9003_1 /TAXON_ID=160604 /ORGANISM="Amphidinium massartii, Strain CS-259" /LENGTH=483 /DNA_ID=CAMNT_0020007661 /DNA_START=1 /DNA_END=1449 /DNA_ORIENTATION=-
MGARRAAGLPEFTTAGPNAHMVCLTDWLGNRLLRNFLLHFSEHHWAETTRMLCLLGVLCLHHLAPGTENLWSAEDLAELVETIQREDQWPTDLRPSKVLAAAGGCGSTSSGQTPRMPRTAWRQQIHRKPSPAWREPFVDIGFERAPNLRTSSPSRRSAGDLSARSVTEHLSTEGRYIDSARTGHEAASVVGGLDPSTLLPATPAASDERRMIREPCTPGPFAAGCRSVSGPQQEVTPVSMWRRSRASGSQRGHGGTTDTNGMPAGEMPSWGVSRAHSQPHAGHVPTFVSAEDLDRPWQVRFGTPVSSSSQVVPPAAHTPPQLGSPARRPPSEWREQRSGFGLASTPGERPAFLQYSSSPRPRSLSRTALPNRLKDPRTTRGGWAAEVSTQDFGARRSGRIGSLGSSQELPVRPLVREESAERASGSRSVSMEHRSMERAVHSTLVPSQEVPLLGSAEASLPRGGGHFWTRSMMPEGALSRERS